MSTPTGIARSHFLAKGVKLAFGSVEESLAISAFNREREMIMTLPIMANAKGEKFNKVLNIWKGNIYPEMKISDIQRLEEFRQKYKKVQDKELTILI
jgi:hypothetical protein